MSPKRRKPGDSWSDLNPRMTFYCPRELQETIRVEAKKDGLSISELIVAAVTDKHPHRTSSSRRQGKRV